VASVINLNRVRKQKKREEAEQRAAANRVAFGRSKAERQATDKERRRSGHELDAKRLDD
jgi:hypothetical protein